MEKYNHNIDIKLLKISNGKGRVKKQPPCYGLVLKVPRKYTEYLEGNSEKDGINFEVYLLTEFEKPKLVYLYEDVCNNYGYGLHPDADEANKEVIVNFNITGKIWSTQNTNTYKIDLILATNDVITTNSRTSNELIPYSYIGVQHLLQIDGLEGILYDDFRFVYYEQPKGSLTRTNPRFSPAPEVPSFFTQESIDKAEEYNSVFLHPQQMNTENLVFLSPNHIYAQCPGGFNLVEGVYTQYEGTPYDYHRLTPVMSSFGRGIRRNKTYIIDCAPGKTLTRRFFSDERLAVFELRWVESGIVSSSYYLEATGSINYDDLGGFYLTPSFYYYVEKYTYDRERNIVVLEPKERESLASTVNQTGKLSFKVENKILYSHSYTKSVTRTSFNKILDSSYQYAESSDDLNSPEERRIIYEILSHVHGGNYYYSNYGNYDFETPRKSTVRNVLGFFSLGGKYDNPYVPVNPVYFRYFLSDQENKEGFTTFIDDKIQFFCSNYRRLNETPNLSLKINVFQFPLNDLSWIKAYNKESEKQGNSSLFPFYYDVLELISTPETRELKMFDYNDPEAVYYLIDLSLNIQ